MFDKVFIINITMICVIRITNLAQVKHLYMIIEYIMMKYSVNKRESP